MKKNLIKSAIFLILLIVFNSCNNDEGYQTISALIHVKHYYTGRRAPTWERITVPSVEVSGSITGNPIPTINHVKIANRIFDSPNCYNFDEGEIRFYSDDRIWIDSIPEPKFSPLSISINTGSGSLEGSIQVPDTIKTLSIPAPDTIPRGTSFSLTWTGSNADFYLVEYYHMWQEDEGYYLGYSRDTFIVGNTLNFIGNLVGKNGDFSEFAVYPVNGPFPGTGAVPNLKGKGYGFLYLENKMIGSNRTVTIGKGIDYSIFEVGLLKSAREKNEEISVFEKIKNKIDPN